MERSLDRWLADAPTLAVDWEPLAVDLPAQPGRPRRAALLAAGGRRQEPAGRRPAVVHDDVRPRQHLHQPAVAAVRPRARRRRRCGSSGDWQGSRRDDFRDEDPGRILHEMRYGEMAAFEERPHSPYYGSVDATPLYVVLLDEYERWTGDREARPRPRVRGAGRAQLDRRVRRPDGQRLHLVQAPERADRAREPVLEGLLELDLVQRRPAARTSRGRPASSRGTRTTPRCAARGWPGSSGRTPTFAERLETAGGRPQAALQPRLLGRATAEYFALALDADGSQVDALASNNGHLLWSGIVDKSKAKAVVGHLMGPRLFSGWGVRTLAEGEGRYNPIGYHVGTVWPFDNSFIAWGLRRYGYKEEAARIAVGHPRRGGHLRRPAAGGVRRLRPRR